MKNYEDAEITDIYVNTLKYLLVVSILLFSLFFENISYALGFASGGIVCLINFKLMIKTINVMLSSTTYSKAFFTGIFCLRLLLSIFILWFALKSEALNLLTAVLGMLSVKTVIIASEILRHYKNLRDLE